MTIQVELQIRVIRRKGSRILGSRKLPGRAHSARIAAASGVDLGRVAVPARHEPRLARPPIVEIEALRAQRRRLLRRDPDEHLIGLDRQSSRPSPAAAASRAAASLAARALRSQTSPSSIARIWAAR